MLKGDRLGPHVLDNLCHGLEYVDLEEVTQQSVEGFDSHSLTLCDGEVVWYIVAVNDFLLGNLLESIGERIVGISH